jgi:hypothetical protein
MLILYVADIPHIEVKAEETCRCSVCKKDTIHRYEEVSFHAKALFIKLYCYKKRHIRICSACNHGEEMADDIFREEVERVNYSKMPKKREQAKLYEKSKEMGIKYCKACGEKIYPDIGYCTSCAVRKPPKKL